jgi:hypothetical protein
MWHVNCCDSVKTSYHPFNHIGSEWIVTLSNAGFHLDPWIQKIFSN